MKETLKNFNTFLEEENLSLGRVVRKPRSITSFTPGEVYSFSYEGKDTSVILVSTNKTKTGFYKSSRSNLLITCIKLDFEIKSVFKYSTLLVLKNLYKKNKESKYNRITSKSSLVSRTLSKFFSSFKEKVRQKTILSLFGKSNFRTYNFSKIYDIHELNINGL